MPIVMRDVVELPEGRFSGKIVSAAIEPSKDKRTGKIYQYLNCNVEINTSSFSEAQRNAAKLGQDGGWDGHRKFSVNANLSKISDLGRLLTRLDREVMPGQSFDEASLVGETIAFDMVREGNFNNIDINSIHRA